MTDPTLPKLKDMKPGDLFQVSRYGQLVFCRLFNRNGNVNHFAPLAERDRLLYVVVIGDPDEEGSQDSYFATGTVIAFDDATTVVPVNQTNVLEFIRRPL